MIAVAKKLAEEDAMERERRDIVSGEIMPENRLVRFVAAPDGSVVPDVAAKLPADRILIETDAPFLAPVPRRGQRNEPAYVTGTAAKLAELLGIEVEEVAATTTRNFETLMGLRS